MADGSDARLEVVLEAKIDRLSAQLSKANQTIGGWAAKTQKQLDQTNDRFGKLFGKTDPGKALDKVFDSTRLKVLDSGVARVGLFGSALESLGPQGLAAAAGIAAVAAAFAGAREAAKFADDISDTANRLHITTDALQEYRFAIRAAGGEEAGADEALEAFSANLGKAQEGLKKGQRAFLALGFTKEQIKGFRDADEALRAVVERLQGLPSQQQDAIVEQLGLQGLKPLLLEGAEKMAELRREAHELGLVMGGELVKKGGELNDQFETVSKVIDVQLKSALIDLGPILLGLVSKMADLARAAADVVDAFRPIEERSNDSLARTYQRLGRRPIQTPFERGERVKILQEMLGREFGPGAAAASAKPKPTHHLLDVGGGSPTKDTTAQRTAEIEALLAGSARGLLQAQLALTANVDERAKIERQIIDEELSKTLAGLDKQRAEIAADQGLSAATKARLAAEIDQAATAEKSAAEARRQLVDREAARKSDDEYFATQKEIGGYFDDMASIAADQASTAKERLEIELRSLDAQQRLERQIQKELLDREVADGLRSQSSADAVLKSADDARAAKRGDLVFRSAGPAEQYLRTLQDLDTEFQSAGVNAVRSLADGLADAIVNAKDLGDVASNVFKQLIAQILSAVIQKEAASFVAAIFGVPAFAGGTNFAPGGVALVGEKGPELVNLPRGAQVIPNAGLPSLASVGRGSTIVQQFFPANFSGAVVTEDLIASFQSYADGVGRQAVVGGGALGQQNTFKRLRTAQRQRLGR